MTRSKSRLRIATSRTGTILASEEFLHSVKPTRRVMTGGVWDLMAIAPLLVEPPADRPLEILLLGVGGGTVLHQWDRLLGRFRWTGVERDDNALTCLTEEYGLPETPGELYPTDATHFLRLGQRRFDVVVDDLFGEDEDALPTRPTFDEPDWPKLLRRNLRRGGLLVTNLVWDDDRENDNRAYAAHLETSWPEVVRLECERYANRVYVCSRSPLAVRSLRSRVERALRKGAYQGIRCRRIRTA